ncbi:MAG: helix-hairpin-helix domain-containing protein, partial [Bacteroidota bacterium]
PDNNYNTQNDPDPSDSVPPAPLGFTRSDDRAPASPPPASPIDLNRADSLTLLKVPGIGPYTAGRILSYRKWLLFFQSVEQLREFRAIRPENFERMAPHLTVGPDFSAFPHIRINEATVEELAAHKYIDWKSARILVAYRGQHGPFQALADLEKVLALPPDLLPKLDGYLAF